MFLFQLWLMGEQFVFEVGTVVQCTLHFPASLLLGDFIMENRFVQLGVSL